MIRKTILAVTLFMTIPAAGQDRKKDTVPCGVQISMTVPIEVGKEFIPSGWMGDGASDQGRKYIQMAQLANPRPRPGAQNNVVTKFTYRPGAVGWAGIYWQWPVNNWGKELAKSVKGASVISFWAAGEKGSEIVEFKAGGIPAKPCGDSFEVSLGSVALTKDWKQYRIPLRIITDARKPIYGAFAWVATGDSNPDGLTFYLDSVRYE
jgi:hypothetical protein